MKTISATKARKNIADLLDAVVRNNEVIGISRRNRIDAILMKFPETYDPNYNDITNLSAASASFDFWADEPELYSLEDAKESYV